VRKLKVRNNGKEEKHNLQKPEMCQKWDKTWTVFQGVAKPTRAVRPAGDQRCPGWTKDGHPQGVLTQFKMISHCISLI
jgi:hypothetical protein